MKSFSEAIKLKDGIYYNLQYHQDRIDRTLQSLGSRSFCLSEILAIYNAPSCGLYKCRVEYGVKQTNNYDDVLDGSLTSFKNISNDDNLENGPKTLLLKVEFIKYVLPTPKLVKLIEDDEIDYSFKSTDRTRLNRLKSNAASDEIIIIKKNGAVTDSSAANLVFERKGNFFTPKTYLLAGTKRQYLLDTNKISECEIYISDIASYDKVYFISAMIDLEDEVCINTRDLLLK